MVQFSANVSGSLKKLSAGAKKEFFQKTENISSGNCSLEQEESIIHKSFGEHKTSSQKIWCVLSWGYLSAIKLVLCIIQGQINMQHEVRVTCADSGAGTKLHN